MIQEVFQDLFSPVISNTDIGKMHPYSKVWIYQANKILPKSISDEIHKEVGSFIVDWTSHSQYLKSTGAFVHGVFLILMVDETHHMASGCSIDKSVHFIKKLEAKYNIDLFDRWNFAIFQDQQLYVVNRDTFKVLYDQGKINDETLIFDNLVDTKAKFVSEWVKPIGQSWHRRFV